ncbi:RibD family protein [Halostreptopolyspora alba]|uniref:RibD family protein n=1 Tax=Halostreptopolyspora alba TaxID=2487137 RepID=A0A3N0EE82_9ACTN|nr:RibD family protein [Nocardiopsaceae bacterium YIM 96095]
MARPHTVLSCAMSLDGRIDDAGPKRLRLSNEDDFDEVDEERAASDAILVGAGTLRGDDPRLLVRSPERRSRRVSHGATEYPIKIVLTASGALDPAARFFTTGDAAKLVYSESGGHATAVRALHGTGDTTVVDAGSPLDPAGVLDDLARRGVRRLLVEGGSRVHTLFLTAGLVDELRVAVAPFLIGDTAAPRFVEDGAFPNGPGDPLRLAETRAVGDMAVLRYRLAGSK